jgi:hypothetical protein
MIWLLILVLIVVLGILETDRQNNTFYKPPREGQGNG